MASLFDRMYLGEWHSNYEINNQPIDEQDTSSSIIYMYNS